MLPFPAPRNHRQYPSVETKRAAAVLLIGLISLPLAGADDRRARPPEFDESRANAVFFEQLSDALRGERPSLASIRQSSQAQQITASSPSSGSLSEGDASDGWNKLISPTSLEDEIKRLRLHFDSVVATPAEFNSGGYQDARLNLSALATLFAVINEYSGDVRWKEDAAAARDLIARTAFNSKAGSTQVYNEAKLRKADLQDLVNGTGLADRDAKPENDWTMIVDRSPLMKYAQSVLDRLEDHTRDGKSIREHAEAIRRDAELIAVLGHVLSREGMHDADDEDYAALSEAMSQAGVGLREVLERGDIEAVRLGTGVISQTCADCHEQYR